MVFTWILFALNLLLVIILILPAIITLIARIRPRIVPNNTDSFPFVACIITAYRRLDLTVPLIQSLLAQSYPNFHVFVVADACEDQELPLNSEKLTLLRPSPSLHSKIKSLRYAVEQMGPNYPAIFILDPDNLVHPTALQRLNTYYQTDYQVVQGQRTGQEY